MLNAKHKRSSDIGHEQIALGNPRSSPIHALRGTDDFARDHERMIAAGVRFIEAPRHEAYGVVAVFEDLCGNRWDLIQSIKRS